jgi:hypothetical protein
MQVPQIHVLPMLIYGIHGSIRNLDYAIQRTVGYLLEKIATATALHEQHHTRLDLSNIFATFYLPRLDWKRPDLSTLLSKTGSA